ncbi:Tc toxin subunit A-related protein [Taibaiella koreensis]|uniref:Tc toxin subunit A-related protein n=1 Tax=Taibaiella koreensis TaxID=1268548 RepID=UPI000E59C187|nr:neuraminidase-like domain-containing protein [Taibaiella koreensis]
MKKISGQLTDQQGRALDHIAYGITIELTTALQSGSPGGWIGSAAINATDARFELFTAYDLKASEQVNYRILNQNNLVQSGSAGITNFATIITLTPEAYEKIKTPAVDGYTTISGKVTLGEAAICAVPVNTEAISVLVIKPHFPENRILGSGRIDALGHYEVKVPKADIQGSSDGCGEAALAQIYVAIRADQTDLARSGSVSPERCCTAIDIHISDKSVFAQFLTELEARLKVLSDRTGLQPSGLANVSDEQIDPLAAQSSLKGEEVRLLVHAAWMSQNLNLALAKLYALFRAGMDHIAVLANMGSDGLYEVLSQAGAWHIIPAVSGIDDLVAVLLDQRGELKGKELTDNGDTLLSLFTLILNNGEDAATFLKIYTADPDLPATAIWDRVKVTLGETKTGRLQKGIQVLAITGMQPELTINLLTTVGEGPVSTLSSLTTQNLMDRIHLENDKHPGKVCIPLAILEAYEGEAAIAEYAGRMHQVIQGLFTSAAIGDKLARDSAFAAALSNAQEAIAFLQANPGYDFRTDNVWDLPTDENGNKVREALMPVQNLVRLTDNATDAVVAMIKAQIRSSADVIAMGQEAFAEAYGAAFKGGVDEAASVYSRAVHNNKLHMEAKMAMSNSSYLTNVFPMLDEPDDTEQPQLMALAAAAPAAVPDMKTLFGSLDMCNCTECTSMYSPGAYYTDILNFMKKKLGGNPSTTFKELTINRRPDLPDIDLTCKNANTPLPYVDLVNELLELAVLRSANLGPAFTSYQTSGTAKELEAYPEHTVKDPDGVYRAKDNYQTVYNEQLRKAVYPNNLPFDLPVEESRTYLQHLGKSRYELMYQLRPKDYAGDTSQGRINELNALAEWLSVTRKEVDIITTPSTTDTPKYWGFGTATSGWYDMLCNGAPGEGLNTVLTRSRITYKEMLQLLVCDYINPVITVTKPLPGGGSVVVRLRTMEIVAVDGALPTTCDLTRLFLKYSKTYEATQPLDTIAVKTNFFTKWVTFLRLQRATGWSAYQLDVVLRSLSAGSANPAVLAPITIPVFKAIAKVHQLSGLLKAPPEYIVSLWQRIDTTQYINFNSDNQDLLPSVYDRIFRNKAVLNPADPNFGDNGAFTGTYSDNTASLVAALGIAEEDFLALLADRGILPAQATVLGALSPVFGLTLLAKGLNMPVKDLLQWRAYFNIAPVTATNFMTLDETETLLAYVDRLKKMAFSQPEIAYLIANADSDALFSPEDDLIRDFYTALRSDLQQLNILPFPDGIPADDEAALVAKLDHVIRQHFTEAFALDSNAVAQLLDTLMLGSTLTLAEGLRLGAFVASAGTTDPVTGIATPAISISRTTGISAFSFDLLYEAYGKIGKSALVINRLKIAPEELQALLLFAGALEITQIGDMPVDVPGPAQIADRLSAFIRLNEWLMVRDRLKVNKTDFPQLLKDASGATSAADFAGTLQRITKWPDTDLQAIVNTLQPVYNAGDYGKAALLLQIAAVMESASLVGLSPATLLNASILVPLVSMANAKAVRMAAKARYSDDEWAKVAKPLQDILRERQRQSLVGYMIGLTNSSNNFLYRDENALYEALLIDVEMKPCMKTSRIKQAISSAQLFMDRVILSLERYNGTALSLSPAMVAQWEGWRKWYRIWEANRKIFLYPENWIEPELRDDKTPFFKELETQLLQDEVTDRTAEDAYRAYLEQLEEVSRLEPVSAFHEISPNINDKDTVHVVARTYMLPHRYYYRKLEYNEWTPWEKMNIDIKSDHVVPYVWEGKLYTFWLTFTKKNVSDAEKNVIKSDERTRPVKTVPDNNPPRVMGRNWGNALVNNGLVADPGDDRYAQWEVRLNWSQRKDDRWLPAEVAKEVMMLAINKLHISDMALNTYTANTNNARTIMSFLTENGDVKIDELFRNRIHMIIRPDVKAYGLTFNLSLPPGIDENGIGLHTFLWKDPSKDPVILRDDIEPDTIIAPANTRINKMKLVEDPLSNGKVMVDKLQIAPAVPYGYYSFSTNIHYAPFARPIRKSSAAILNNTPKGRFKLTAPAANDSYERFSVLEPLQERFFFEDDKNTYYVQKEKGTIGSATTVLTAVKKQNSVLLDDSKMLTATFYKKNPWMTEITSGAVQLMAATATSGPQLFSKDLSLGNPITTYTQQYRFQTFYHAQITDFFRVFNKSGIPGLLQLSNQRQEDYMAFSGTYQPTSLVHSLYPTDKVQFGFDEAYGRYNWELFFHAPMLVAQRLSENQQFEEARKWYHYVFDPTSNRDGMTGAVTGEKKRFWKFYPFYKAAQGTILTLEDLVLQIHNGVGEALQQVDKWEANPFKPHVIARMRVLAYMKNVLMKYLDNLIAWADQLFGRDTIESINEATQLYVLAAQLLGKRPQDIPARAKVESHTFEELDGAGLDALSNAMVPIESYFAPNDGPLPQQGTKDDHTLSIAMFYFCLPKNDKLLGYWDTVADRLFKIRNCMNIDGSVRELALYEPPIDPALLVRAAAKGISIDTVLNSLSASSLSVYRFSYVLQKANEFSNDVKSLGGALLSAIEKKDAEQLALIRSGQERQVLQQTRYIKEVQVQEATANLESARRSRENAQARQQYYASRVFMNAGEAQHLQSVQTGMILQAVQGGLQATSSALALIPQFHGQAAMAVGASFGGQQLSTALNAISAGIGIAAAINSGRGSMSLTRAGYERRMDDWQFQASTAAKEMEQLDQQILAAEIRLDIANRELVNHDLQISNNEETDAYMRSKFSNVALYSWMIGQIATTYFQSYQLAFDMAKKAEACMDLELPLVQKPAAGFIGFAYWDSLRKGLQSGEKLQADLRKMEAAYMDNNKRELELTKNISLALTDPAALLDLRTKGSCVISLPEALFDLDYPGHYLRRIKSVSLSLPCIAGPYTTVAATLTLTKHLVRKSDSSAVNPVTENIRLQPIATSNGQNDGGVFELNFRDERYLPFEGRGAVSEWELRLADEDQVRLFDFETISDVIMHLRYTAREGKAAYRTERVAAINQLVEALPADPAQPFLARYFSLKHDYSNDWYAYAAVFGDNAYARMRMSLNNDRFPFFCKDRNIGISRITARLQGKQVLTGSYRLSITYTKSNTGAYQTKVLELTAGPGNVYERYADFTLADALQIDGNTKMLQLRLEKTDGSTVTKVNMDELLDDLYLVVSYQLGEPGATPAPDDRPQGDVPLGDLAAWWQADARNVMLPPTKYISSLTDQSGNGVHLGHYNPSEAPLLTDANGRKVVRFEESILYNGSQVDAIAGDDSCTLFYVGSAGIGIGLDAGSNRHALDIGRELFEVRLTASGDELYSLQPGDPAGIRARMYVVDQSIPGSTTLKVCDPQLVVQQQNTFANGTFVTTGSTGLVMGAKGAPGAFRDGDFYEALVYKGLLSAGDQRAVMAYLKGKYPFAV